MITPVILSGGSGSRLWPLSRSMYPKQLLPLMHGDDTLLQQTILRCKGIAEIRPPIVVCNEEHRFMVGEQLKAINLKEPTILLEPFGRDTAPAIALTALYLADSNPDALMLVMPADQNIADIPTFQKTVVNAVSAAKKGSIVTFGIVPNEPNTGFGYIKVDTLASTESSTRPSKVLEFKEKPDAQTAQQYIDQGGYYWNGGMFLLTAKTYLTELEKFAPEMLDACRKSMLTIRRDFDFLRIDKEAFAQCPSQSIDYALMEHTDKAMMIPLDAYWNDVGSWSALWQVAEKDSDGNAIYGDVVAKYTSNSTVFSQSRLVATIGVRDLVVVETPDAVLVSDREHAQYVKELVNHLRAQGRMQAEHHRKVYRPWGWYDSIELGEGFQVKRIQLKPLARLSVQAHKHRAEHWVVVSGVAEVLRGESVSLLKENESSYIPIGMKHSLHNPSETECLEIIEVQTGDYLGEDDIVRYDDQYGRLNGWS